MPAAIGVKGADTHEAMDAPFGLGMAVGVGTDDAQAGRLDAGFFARL